MTTNIKNTDKQIIFEKLRSEGDLKASINKLMKNDQLKKFTERAARELDTDPAVIAGIVISEYGADSIKTGDNIRILFMIRRWIPKYKEKFPDKELPSWANKNFTNSKKIYDEAYKLWPKETLKETSWGLGQVHGFEFKKLGYDSPEQMVKALKSSAKAQEDSLINFIKNKPNDGYALRKAVKEKDWWAIARYYNGGTDGTYATNLQTMYNHLHPDNPDNQAIAKSKREYDKTKKDSGSKGVIINIGDSNGKIKLRATSTPGLNKAAVGASMENWRDALKLYFEGKSGSINTGNVKIQIPFKDKSGKPIPLKDSDGKFPTINIAVVGGNDISKRGEAALKDSYIKDVAIELMKYIKKTGGSFGGPAPTSNSAKISVKMGGESQMKLRKELNKKLKKAANDMGVPYIDNIEEILSKYGEDNPDSIYRKDGIHLKTSSFKGAQKDDSEEMEFDQPDNRKRGRQIRRRRLSSLGEGPRLKHAGGRLGIGNKNVKLLAVAVDKDIDFRKFLNSFVFRPLEDDSVSAKVPQQIRQFTAKYPEGSEFYYEKPEDGKLYQFQQAPESYEINKGERKEIFQRLRNYAISDSEEDLTKLLWTPEDFNFGFKAYSLLSKISEAWVEGDLKEKFKRWKKEFEFLTGKRFEEKKGNNQMRITKERLAQIIKEEVEAYKASQLNEVDIDELEEAEAYIKEIADLLKSTYETFFRGAAPAIGTPQTKADTGEPVTDQTAHEDAKGLLLDLLGDAIDEFQEKDSMNEDGHDDVPSAVRAMKTIAEDAMEMLQALEQMDGALPTWWTNKMAVSASMLNKMRDYLLVPSMEEEMDEQ